MRSFGRISRAVENEDTARSSWSILNVLQGYLSSFFLRTFGASDAAQTNKLEYMTLSFHIAI
jgi:hypothetical protein